MFSVRGLTGLRERSKSKENRDKSQGKSTSGQRAGTSRRDNSQGPVAETRRRDKSRGRDKAQDITAPHPVAKGREDQVCPIIGLSAHGSSSSVGKSALTAFEELANDPDIVEERRVLSMAKLGNRHASLGTPRRSVEPRRFIPLNVSNGAHMANSHTRQLVRSVGLPTLRRFTSTFYKKAFADPHLDQFIRSHHDEHGERFALWIAEKFGDGTPWTEERKTRPREVLNIGGHWVAVAHDRSSAHFAAWNSPKRKAEKRGEHFKLDDSRVWMRLHFWAAREMGLFEPEHAAFMDYYVRFIGHFVSIYSSDAPSFTRESARWSADPSNIQKYLDAGSYMADVINKPVELERGKLPKYERLYTGSRHPKPAWPYELHVSS